MHKWLTTANGHLRILMFDAELDSEENSKLLKTVAFILSVYVPMFFLIHLNPRVSEGPANMVFLVFYLISRVNAKILR